MPKRSFVDKQVFLKGFPYTFRSFLRSLTVTRAEPRVARHRDPSWSAQRLENRNSTEDLSIDPFALESPKLCSSKVGYDIKRIFAILIGFRAPLQ